MSHRTLSPAEQQALQREDARYLLLPLTTTSGPRSMAAHLRHAIRLLRDRNVPSPTSSVAARLNALYDLTTPHHPAIVCKRGCSICCSQNVTVTAPEAFLLAATIRADARLTASVLAADERLRGLAPEAHTGPQSLGKRPCPLLVDHACGVYAQRPMACRAFVSVDYSDCVATFAPNPPTDVRPTDTPPPDIRMPVAHTHTLFAVRMMILAALRHEGLDDNTYELTAAVAVALRDPDAEARWLRGEPVFAGIRANPPIPREAAIQIGQMVEHVTGTV